MTGFLDDPPAGGSCIALEEFLLDGSGNDGIVRCDDKCHWPRIAAEVFLAIILVSQKPANRKKGEMGAADIAQSGEGSDQNESGDFVWKACRHPSGDAAADRLTEQKEGVFSLFGARFLYGSGEQGLHCGEGGFLEIGFRRPSGPTAIARIFEDVDRPEAAARDPGPRGHPVIAHQRAARIAMEDD